MGNRAPSRSKSINRYESIKRQSNILRTKINPIQEDYTISNGIGEGMNGKVYLIVNKHNKKKYALKKLNDDKNSRREIELQWRSSQYCENIVKIIDVYENKIKGSKCLLVVMEYMEGGELFDRLKKKKKFTEQEVAKIMKQICNAVNHLHKMGIAHRDLKPENLLLSSKDDNAIIKLSDFGFAKEAYKGLNTPNFTPYYVPPEILLFEKYDISCDVWSLGVIMYILCCGYPPFYSSSGDPISPGMKKRIKKGEYVFPSADWVGVSQDAKDLIRGMLETIPDQRLKIDDVLKSKWLLNSLNLPKTRLNSIKVLNTDMFNLKEITEGMSEALGEMRVNENKKLNIKSIDVAENALLKRRMDKMSQKIKLQNLEKLDESIENASNNKRINRSLSLPHTSPNKAALTAFYYTSNLKNEHNNNDKNI